MTFWRTKTIVKQYPADSTDIARSNEITADKRGRVLYRYNGSKIVICQNHIRSTLEKRIKMVRNLRGLCIYTK
jgi:hypothetical protein